MSRTYHFKTGARKSRALGMTLSLCVGLFASSSWAFSLDDVAAKAEKLAAEDYTAPQSNLPPVFRNMAFADYQQLRFRGDKALWHDAPTPFEVQFYHQGMHFNVPVRINEITAKGVETEDQLAFLRSIGCDEIQGYYFSRPLPGSELEKFLRNFEDTWAIRLNQDRRRSAGDRRDQPKAQSV